MTRTSEDAAQNSQQYTITDHSGFIEASGAFIYRGYLISFSTMGYNRMITRTPVLVINNNGNGSIEKILTPLNPPSSTSIAGWTISNPANQCQEIDYAS